MFLGGWGLSMFWGMIGDRIGRVRALALTIVAYSVFTLLCGLVTTVYQLADFTNPLRIRAWRSAAGRFDIRGRVSA